MSDDDFPHLAEERKAYRRNVAFAIVGVFLAIGVFVLRLAARKDHERDVRGMEQLNRALSEQQPFDLPTTPTVPATADRAPVELEVVLGDRHLDVAGAPIALPDGRTLELVARPEWTHAGKDLSFRHAPAVRVQDGDTLMLSTRDATAEIGVVDSTVRDDAEALAAMAEAYTATGQVESNEATSHTLLGKRATGARLVATRLVIELLTARLDGKRRLSIIVTGTSADADLSPLLAAVETVTAKRLAPTPEFDAILRDAAGAEVGRGPAAIDAPTKLGPDKLSLVVRRRPTVKEQLSGLSFEHSPQLSAFALAAPFPTVQLRSGDVGIQIMAPPMALAVDELFAGISGGVDITNKREVHRTFGGTVYTGTGGDMAIGTLVLAIEVFAFQRDGRDFMATLQYPVEGSSSIERLASPVIASLH